MNREQLIKEYQILLRQSRIKAQEELLELWEKTSIESWPEKITALSRPFYRIVEKYGTEASAHAVNFLILTRSLDDELRFLPTEKQAPAATFGQTFHSLRWALRHNKPAPDHLAIQGLAHRKLAGTLNRLVLQPARDTVYHATVRAGTGYARVVSPGSCNFCLMLASRGAVYTNRTALVTENGRRYHDNCRCIAIEVKDKSQLPQLNQELEQVWQNLSRSLGGRTPTMKQWEEFMDKQREKTQATTEFRPLSHIDKVKWTQGKERFVLEGKTYTLPNSDHWAAHVLFGWRGDDTTPPWKEDREKGGHTADSLNRRKSKFPASWSDQTIVDAVQDTFENPDSRTFEKTNNDRERIVFVKTVDGVTIHGIGSMMDGEIFKVFAYPKKTIKG